MILKKLIVSMIAAFAVGELMAFNSAEWLEKRKMFKLEAERLRAAYSNYVALATSPAEMVSIPVESFPDGSVKIIITADKAQYFNDAGFIVAFNVSVKKFEKDGTIDSQIDAEKCVIDRETKSGWAEGAATIKQRANTICGENVYFSSLEGYIRITSNTDIKLDNLKLTGIGQ